jgi:predicted kinase
MRDSCSPVHEERHAVWSNRAVTLICGPPGSGKSTLARQIHSHVLELESIDVDDYRLRLKLFGRNAYRIGRSVTADHAVVRGAPGRAERVHHENLCRPSRTIVLLTPPDICHQRVAERDRETVGGEHTEIDRWWSVWRKENPTERRSARWA